MERIERLREFINSWSNYHPNLKELTWDLYIELQKELEEYDAKRNTH